MIGAGPAGTIRTAKPGDVFRQLGEEIHVHCRCPRHKEHCCGCGEPKGRWWQ